MAVTSTEKIFKKNEEGTYIRQASTLVHLTPSEEVLELKGNWEERIQKLCSVVLPEYFPGLNENNSKTQIRIIDLKYNRGKFNFYLASNKFTEDRYFSLFSKDLSIAEAENLSDNAGTGFKQKDMDILNNHGLVKFSHMGLTIQPKKIPLSVFDLVYDNDHYIEEVIVSNNKTCIFKTNTVKSIVISNYGINNLFKNKDEKSQVAKKVDDLISNKIWGHDLWHMYAYVISTLAKGKDILENDYHSMKREPHYGWRINIYNPTLKRIVSAVDLFTELIASLEGKEEKLAGFLHLAYFKGSVDRERRKADMLKKFQDLPRFPKAKELSDLLY